MKSHLHCVYQLSYHLVLVTKYRKKCLHPELRNYMKEVMEGVLKKWECELIEFNGEEDHVHLLINAHPSLQLSKLVNNLKTVSSRMVRKNYEEHLKNFYWKPVLWTRAYCVVSTGGASMEVIKKYIEKQGKK